MRLLATLLAIAALAVLGSYGRLVRLRAALGVEQLIESGFLFLLVGILLGPHGAGLMTPEVIGQLDPLVTLALGTFGFLLGLELHVFRLRGLEGRLLLAAGVEGGMTLAVVSLPMAAVLELFTSEPFDLRLFTGLMIGAAAAISSGKALAAVERRHPLPGRDRIMRVADLDSVFVVLASGVLLAFMPRAATGAAPLPVWGWTLATLAIGLVCGFAGWLLLGGREGEADGSKPAVSRNEQAVFLGGVLLLCAGVANSLRLSPAAAGLLAGTTLAHLPGDAAARARRALEPLQHLLPTVFLLIAGASWTLSSFRALALLPLYLLFRVAGKVAGGALAGRISGAESAGRLEFGLLSPGILAIGLALNYQMAYPGSGQDSIVRPAVAVIVAGSALCEIAAAWTARMPRWREV